MAFHRFIKDQPVSCRFLIQHCGQRLLWRSDFVDEAFTLQVDPDPGWVLGVQSAIAAWIARINQPPRIIPLVIHIVKDCSHLLRHFVTGTDRVDAGTDQYTLREAKILRPVFAQHLQIALKSASRQDHCRRVKTARLARAQVFTTSASDASVFRDLYGYL